MTRWFVLKRQYEHVRNQILFPLNETLVKQLSTHYLNTYRLLFSGIILQFECRFSGGVVNVMCSTSHMGLWKHTVEEFITRMKLSSMVYCLTSLDRCSNKSAPNMSLELCSL